MSVENLASVAKAAETQTIKSKDRIRISGKSFSLKFVVDFELVAIGRIGKQRRSNAGSRQGPDPRDPEAEADRHRHLECQGAIGSCYGSPPIGKSGIGEI